MYYIKIVLCFLLFNSSLRATIVDNKRNDESRLESKDDQHLDNKEAKDSEILPFYKTEKFIKPTVITLFFFIWFI